MSFADQLKRLRDAAKNRQKGVDPEKAYVDRRDLQELIYNFDRIDADLRSNFDYHQQKYERRLKLNEEKIAALTEQLIKYDLATPMQFVVENTDLSKLGQGVLWMGVDNPPKEPGWYSAALNPQNNKELTQKQINEWRKTFGYAKVWFNPDANGYWYEPNSNGHGMSCIGEIVTHWAMLPSVPPLPPNHKETD